MKNQYLNGKGIPALLIAAVVVGTGLGAGLATTNPFQTESPSVQEHSDAAGGVVIVTKWRDYDNDGEKDKDEILHRQKKHNLVVDQGLNFFQYQVSGQGAPNNEVSRTDNATYIALSNAVATIDANDKKLDGEITGSGLARADGTYQDRGNGNYSVWNTFTATSSVNNVNKTGLMWNGTAGSPSLVAANTFQDVDLQTDDKLTINWTKISFN